MKLQFNKKDGDEFKAYLKNNGYKQYNGAIRTEDYYFAKTLCRSKEDDCDRSALQMFFSFYDFSKYKNFNNESFLRVQPTISVSRNIDERIEMLICSDNISDVSEFESIALKFYSFINSNIQIKTNL